MALTHLMLPRCPDEVTGPFCTRDNSGLDTSLHISIAFALYVENIYKLLVNLIVVLINIIKMSKKVYL